MRYVLPADEEEFVFRMRGNVIGFQPAGEHIEMLYLEDDDSAETERTFHIFEAGRTIIAKEWQYLGSVGNKHVFEWFAWSSDKDSLFEDFDKGNHGDIYGSTDLPEM